LQGCPIDLIASSLEKSPPPTPHKAVCGPDRSLIVQLCADHQRPMGLLFCKINRRHQRQSDASAANTVRLI
jgi:hypothetical protein